MTHEEAEQKARDLNLGNLLGVEIESSTYAHRHVEVQDEEFGRISVVGSSQARILEDFHPRYLVDLNSGDSALQAQERIDLCIGAGRRFLLERGIKALYSATMAWWPLEGAGHPAGRYVLHLMLYKNP